MPRITANLDFLLNKANSRAVTVRENNATAEDFHEIAALFGEIIGVVNSLTGDETQNATYGVHTTLLLLQAAHPTADPGSYAVIDPGTGIAARLALWDDNDTMWVLQETTSTTTTAKLVVGEEASNVTVTDTNGDAFLIVSGTFEGLDEDKLESYSKNSIYRAL